MPDKGIANANDFRAALERTSVERVVLPASGLAVLLCRPPVFAALEMGRVGTQLQARITEAKPEEVKAGDIEAFTTWLTETLARLFVEPRFAAAPDGGQIGLADILIDDLKFIFRWLRGEVFSEKLEARSEKLQASLSSSSLPTSNSSTEDLGRFPGGQRTAPVSGGSSEAQPLSPQSTPRPFWDAGVPARLHRG